MMDIDPTAAKAAALLLRGWHDPAQRLQSLPHDLRPKNVAEAIAIQQAVARETGPIGGWKVGTPGPQGLPNCSPMPLGGLHQSPARVPTARWPMRAVEAEICFRLGRDLPVKDGPYTRTQVIAGIDTCHPGIELLQSRFADPDKVDPLSNLADSFGHGCYVTGAAIAGWEAMDWPNERVRVLYDGREEIARTGSPADDMIGLVVWLANEGAAWAGGLGVGQIVTTGSWHEGSVVPADASNVRAVFEHAGDVMLDFT